MQCCHSEEPASNKAEEFQNKTTRFTSDQSIGDTELKQELRPANYSISNSHTEP
jgi:hypothetical protein